MNDKNEINILPGLISALRIISTALDPMLKECKEYSLKELKLIADRALALELQWKCKSNHPLLNKKDSVNNLRRVQITFNDGSIRNGWFHAWGQYNDGDIAGMLGIVEFEDGSVDTVPPAAIQFIDTYHMYKKKNDSKNASHQE